MILLMIKYNRKWIFLHLFYISRILLNTREGEREAEAEGEGGGGGGAESLSVCLYPPL